MIKGFIPMTLAAATIASAASITVSPSDTKQKIVGFGAGAVYYQNWITALGKETQEAFYDTAFTGLNLSLLRLGNWKQDADKSLTDDAAIVLAGKKRLGSHLKLEMSSWSAPASLKPSNSIDGKDGNGDKKKNTLNTSSTDSYGSFSYGEFAHWWKTAYQAYEAAGIAPDYISLQNEPDMDAPYEETLFEPAESNGIAGYNKALEAVSDSLNTLANPPKILGPEPLGIGYNNFQNYMAKLDDSKLGGYAYHLYHAGDGNDDSEKNYENPENFRKPMKAIASQWGSDTKPLIMTEFCSMTTNGQEKFMTGLAHIMQVGFTDGKLNGYIAWELFWGDGNGQLIGVCTKGWGACTEDKITINPEYHAMRHYSKFVNPGWRVVSSVSEGNNLYAVAFRSADCDSITVVAINEGASALSLNAPAVEGYEAKYAVQSVENGDKSKEIATSVSYSLPANSITTFVYTTDNTAALQCEDSPVDEPYVEPSLGESAIIADYSASTSIDNWSGDFKVSLGTTEIDGVSKYVTVPLAGCEQGSSDDCGYQHAIISLPISAAEALQSCKALSITMHSMDDTTAYVNIGGAGGTDWINYQYGVQAGNASWVTTEVPLDNEKTETGVMGSNQITMNSNASGVYISKIEAIDCGETTSIRPVQFAISDSHLQAQLFDLNGNLVWTGVKSQALNANGSLNLNVRQGAYILKTRNSTVKAIKK